MQSPAPAATRRCPRGRRVRASPVAFQYGMKGWEAVLSSSTGADSTGGVSATSVFFLPVDYARLQRGKESTLPLSGRLLHPCAFRTLLFLCQARHGARSFYWIYKVVPGHGRGVSGASRVCVGSLLVGEPVKQDIIGEVGTRNT